MAKKNRKNKAKFKWTKELIILLVLLVAMVTATIVLSIPSSKTKTTTSFNEAITAYNTSNSTSYSTLSTENVFVEVEHKKLLNKIEKEVYVYVIYGSLSDGTVLQYLSTINSVATQEEIETVYFYSSAWVEETEDTDTEAFKTKKQELEADINKNVNRDVEALDLLEYPALLVFHNGELIFNSQTYSDNEQYTWNMFIQKAFYISK